jgi:hypothetical protein
MIELNPDPGLAPQARPQWIPPMTSVIPDPTRCPVAEATTPSTAIPREPGSFERAAVRYAARGWPVLPLHSIRDGRCTCGNADCGSAGKHPRTAHGCKDGWTDSDIIRGWWSRWPDANIGVCTGAESGIVMLGPDGDAGIMDLANLEEQFGYLPDTPTAKSGSGGRHLLFRHPGQPLKNRKNHLGTSIDARGDGGYFVAAPSANANGNYEWIDGPDDVPVAEMPQWLVEWWTRDKIAPPPPPDDPLPYRPTPGADNYARAVAYVAGMPEAIGTGGHRGHDATFKAARACYTGFALSVEETYRLLRTHYNPRCIPPWNDGELRHKAQSAADTPSRYPRGYLLRAERSDRGGTANVGTAGTTGPGDEPRKPRFQIYSDAEFASGDFRPNWLIKNVLVRGEPYGIGAAMKSLKTSLGCDMAISLATGTPFLNTFAVVKPVGTLFLSGESGRGTTQMLRSRILASRQLRGIDPNRMFWQFDVPQLDDLTGMEELVDEYARRDVEVAILDPLYLMFGDVDPKSIFEAGRALRNVAKVFVDRGVTPILIHHANRTLKTGEKMELHHLSHAGFAEFVRQFMLINRTTEFQYDGRHSLNVRFGGSVGLTSEHAVEVDEGILLEDFSGRKWDVTVTSAVQVRQATVEDKDANRTEATRRKMAAKRTKFLADIDTEMEKGFPAVTANKLKTDYGWQHADIKTISECLLLDGLIEPHEFTFKAGKGSPQTATGFRRPVPSTQIELQFPDEPVGNDQPVFSEGQPAQPADAGDGGGHHADEPVGLSPLKGDNHGQPADAHHPEENRKTNQVKPAKTGRRKKPADATMRGKRTASRDRPDGECSPPVISADP